VGARELTTGDLGRILWARDAAVAAGLNASWDVVLDPEIYDTAVARERQARYELLEAVAALARRYRARTIAAALGVPPEQIEALLADFAHEQERRISGRHALDLLLRRALHGGGSP
jgi:hypothetical protein